MARQFTVTLTSGTDSGPYNIYYDSVSSGTLATLCGTPNLAENLTLSQVQSGVCVEVPNDADRIIFYNTNPDIAKDCETNQEVHELTNAPSPTPTTSPTPSPTPSPSPTQTLTPTPSPTTEEIPCQCYEFINTTNSAISYTYTDCSGTIVEATSNTEPWTFYVCAKSIVSVASNKLTYSLYGSCTEGVCNGMPTPTPTSTSTPTPTPTPSPTPNCDFDMDINVVTPTPTPTATSTLPPDIARNGIYGAISNSFSPVDATIWYSISNETSTVQPYPTGFTWTQLGSVKTLPQCNDDVYFGYVDLNVGEKLYYQLRDTSGTIIYQNSAGFKTAGPDPCTTSLATTYTTQFWYNEPGSYNIKIKLEDPSNSVSATEDTGTCQFWQVDTSIIDQTRYGVVYTHPSSGSTQSTFNQMESSIDPNNENIVVFGVCSESESVIYDSDTNSVVMTPPGITRLEDGGACSENQNCILTVQPTPTPTATSNRGDGPVGSNVYYLSSGRSVSNDFCGAPGYNATLEITSSAPAVEMLLNTTVYDNLNPIVGNPLLFYFVSEHEGENSTETIGSPQYIRIGEDGVVTDVGQMCGNGPYSESIDPTSTPTE